MHLFKKIFVHSLGHYITALVLAVAIAVFRFSVLSEAAGTRFACYDILSVAGAVVFLFGALMTVAYLGAFDLFGFVFSQGRTGQQKKYKDYAAYSQKKSAIRARGEYYFIPYYVVGTAVFLLSFFFA